MITHGGWHWRNEAKKWSGGSFLTRSLRALFIKKLRECSASRSANSLFGEKSSKSVCFDSLILKQLVIRRAASVKSFLARNELVASAFARFCGLVLVCRWTGA